jgi:predicted membrane channel-forming protein YqfA (hemolysin III family)
MLAGGATSVALLATVAVAAPPPLSTAFLAPFILLTAAVLLHMPFSVGFHLFRGINADVYNLWRRLDQIFIFFASVLLALALSWHAYESAAAIALNTAAAAVVAVAAVREIVGLQPHYQRPRGAMVAFVGSIVMCYWWPMGVTAVRELAAGTPTAATWTALGTFAVLQAGGAAYACGFPERAFPGIFDVCMFSHQLMHVAALAAHVLEYCFVWSLATQSHGALSAAT